MKDIGLLLLSLFLFCSYSYSQNPCPNVATVVYAGKKYNTVVIGDQCWLKENLDVGTMINASLNQTNNSTIEKYCYNNDPANCSAYGGLYHWNEAMQYITTSGAQGICPTGWHIPTYAEYQTLGTVVSNNGNSLKAVGQGNAQYGGAGTNTSGFSALLAGFLSSNGSFGSLGDDAVFWSSMEYSATYAYYVYLFGSDNNINYNNGYKESGFSVRCVKDELTGIDDHSNNTLPRSFDLLQNFPNPFNPSTTIKYSLPKSGNVKLTVFNSLGSKVAAIVDEYKPAGNYSAQFNGSNLASGIYLYKLESGNYSAAKKFILMK